MSALLGIRIAFAGGRESVARMALMAVGVAVGVALLLFTLTAMPVLQRHIDRLAWHRTTEASRPTAPDPALWLGRHRPVRGPGRHPGAGCRARTTAAGAARR